MVKDINLYFGETINPQKSEYDNRIVIDRGFVLLGKFQDIGRSNPKNVEFRFINSDDKIISKTFELNEGWEDIFYYVITHQKFEKKIKLREEDERKAVQKKLEREKLEREKLEINKQYREKLSSLSGYDQFLPTDGGAIDGYAGGKRYSKSKHRKRFAIHKRVTKRRRNRH
jgi:hypothetical protein